MRKTDRRTLYTKTVIKDAFLDLCAQESYSRITIADLCRRAQISRGTFYLHYSNVAEVLEETISDVLDNIRVMIPRVTQTCQDESCSVPLCIFLRRQTRYRGLFLDDTVSGILVSRLTDAFSSDLMAAVREKSDLTPQEIRTLSYFQLNGCLAVCRQSLKAGDGEWDQTRCLLDRFVSAGMTAFIKDKQKQDECKDKQSEEGRR